MMTDTQDNELIVFGEHNVHAENLSIGHLVTYFPWTKLFNALGMVGATRLCFTQMKKPMLCMKSYRRF